MTSAHVKRIRYREVETHALKPTARCGYDRPPSAPDALQPVLSIRGRVEGSEVPAFIRSALREIRAHIEDHHLEVQGAPFSLCRPASPAGVDVEVGWPVSHASGGGRISSSVLPMGLVRPNEERAAHGQTGSLVAASDVG